MSAAMGLLLLSGRFAQLHQAGRVSDREYFDVLLCVSASLPDEHPLGQAAREEALRFVPVPDALRTATTAAAAVPVRKTA